MVIQLNDEVRRQLDKVEHEAHRHIDELNNHVDKKIESVDREAHRHIDELNKYVDSRFDKTLDNISKIIADHIKQNENKTLLND